MQLSHYAAFLYIRAAIITSYGCPQIERSVGQSPTPVVCTPKVSLGNLLLLQTVQPSVCECYHS